MVHIYIYFLLSCMCVSLCSSLFLEHVSSCFVPKYACLLMIFLCLFWLGWHMFLLSGHSKSTSVVHVGGAVWLYYFRRIVHLDFIFRERKLQIIFIYYFYSYSYSYHISLHNPCLCPHMFCLFSFSRWRWIYVCART